MLNPQVDDGGYDLVFDVNAVVRHVQLKSSFRGSTVRELIDLLRKSGWLKISSAKSPASAFVQPDFRKRSNNGLPLSPHVDKLFDRGRISLTDSGNILIADSSVREVMEQWGLDPAKDVGSFNPNQKRYSAFHREVTFRQ